MTEQTKTAPPPLHPQYIRDSTWYPLRSWWSQPSRLFNQDFGLPPFLEAGDLSWVDIIHRRLASSCWPGYMYPPLLMPSVLGFMQHPSPKPSKAEEAELPEAEQYRWRVILDVGHFSPSEITLRTQAGFLEVGGKHEERPDEHGFIARCFTRKYKIPIGVDPTKIQSTLSGDGILCVDAPLPESCIPADIIIPVQVEKETVREEGEKDGPKETAEADTASRDQKTSDSGFPEAPEFTSTEPATEALEHGETHLEAPGDEAHPAGSAAGTVEHDEGRGGEDKTPAELTGETPPTGGADDEGREAEELPEPSVPEPSEPHETPDSPDTPDTVTSDQGEHTDPAQEGGELQPAEGSGETAEELPQPVEAEAGVSPPEETGAGVSPPEEAGAGVSPSEEAGAGVSPPEEAGAGVSPPEEAGAGVSPPEETGAGVSLPEEAGAGVSPPEEAGAGVSPPEETGAGVSPPEETGAGVSLPEEAGAGVSPPEETGADVSLPEEAGAGVSLPEEAGAGVSPPEEAHSQELEVPEAPSMEQQEHTK